jgi:GTP cyclohydrolase I
MNAPDKARFLPDIQSQLDQAGFKALVRSMLDRLEADSGTIEMRFPYFVDKTAPVSGVRSLLDIEVCWHGSIDSQGDYVFRMQVMVPATSLCPCSKEISLYGAHNQRSQSQGRSHPARRRDRMGQ